MMAVTIGLVREIAAPLSRAELIELTALENKVAVEVALQGEIAAQVRPLSTL